MKKVVFSGIKPSGDLTLGNYLGALKNWVKLQDDHETFYCVVDLHAITVRQEPKNLRKRTLEVLAIYISSGLDPQKNTFFIQSHVPAHTELGWLLNCYSYMGELSRITQYKDKKTSSNENILVGIFDYPVLMASDILLYQTNLVPVGKDQFQHLELTRDLCTRFNNVYSETFTMPETFTSKEGSKIMDLQFPTKKMSKSDANPNSYILIMDPPDVIRKKISKAVTDTVGTINYSDDQPGIKNLINIYASIEDISAAEVVEIFKDKSYVEFKNSIADVVIKELMPVQEKVQELLKDKSKLEEIYQSGAKYAQYVSNKTLRKVKKKIGLIP